MYTGVIEYEHNNCSVKIVWLYGAWKRRARKSGKTISSLNVKNGESFCVHEQFKNEICKA